MTKNEIVTQIVIALIEKGYIQPISGQGNKVLVDSAADNTVSVFNRIYEGIKAEDSDA